MTLPYFTVRGTETPGPRRKMLAGVLLMVAVLCALVPATGLAQDGAILPEPGVESEAEVQSEPRVGARPDWSWLEQLRFVTTSDFPPFNYYDEDGVLTGLHVELARDICRVLSVNCRVSELNWSDLTGALEDDAADSAIAAIAITPRALERLDFSDLYIQIPARFTARREFATDPVTPERLAGVSVGVERGTAHHAYLRTFFPGTDIKSFDSVDDARTALRAGDVDLVFADGLSTVFWVNGAGSRGCCKLAGGGFMETKYFGEGLAIAVKRGNGRLVNVLDYALARLRASGRIDELMLRYFPLSLY